MVPQRYTLSRTPVHGRPSSAIHRSAWKGDSPKLARFRRHPPIVVPSRALLRSRRRSRAPCALPAPCRDGGLRCPWSSGDPVSSGVGPSSPAPHATVPSYRRPLCTPLCFAGSSYCSFDNNTANHDYMALIALANLRERAYAPECVEGAFSELRAELLGSLTGGCISGRTPGPPRFVQAIRALTNRQQTRHGGSAGGQE